MLRLKEQKEQAVTEANEQHEAALAQVNEEHAAALAEAKQQHEDALAGANSRHAEALEKARLPEKLLTGTEAEISAGEVLVQSALEQPRVLVHRDFHSRNLMPQADGALAIIDFQDAVEGGRDAA